MAGRRRGGAPGVDRSTAVADGVSMPLPEAVLIKAFCRSPTLQATARATARGAARNRVIDARGFAHTRGEQHLATHEPSNEMNIDARIQRARHRMFRAGERFPGNRGSVASTGIRNGLCWREGPQSRTGVDTEAGLKSSGTSFSFQEKTPRDLRRVSGLSRSPSSMPGR